MDGYISKPLRVDELFATIDRLAPCVEQEEQEAKVMNESFDRETALANVGGDYELLLQVTGLFLSQVEQLLPEIRRAGEAKDAKTLERSVHKPKGSMAVFGATAAVEAAQRMEVMGRDVAFAESQEGLVQLEREVSRLTRSLRKLQG